MMVLAMNRHTVGTGFVIVRHPEAVIEVVYPAEPVSHDVVAYLGAMTRAIGAETGPWMCLVDQRPLLGVIQPALLERLAMLNRYAKQRQMLKSARIVASSAAALQARRLAEEAGVANVVRTFTARDDAWGWLTS